MRTHLLHTVHVAPAAERDTDVAANDPDYANDAQSAASNAKQRDISAARSREDEYTLGGYAGI